MKKLKGNEELFFNEIIELIKNDMGTLQIETENVEPGGYISKYSLCKYHLTIKEDGSLEYKTVEESPYSESVYYPVTKEKGTYANNASLLEISTPSLFTTISPLVGSYNPIINLISVVLPAPDSPAIPTKSPLLILIDKSDMTGVFSSYE